MARMQCRDIGLEFDHGKPVTIMLGADSTSAVMAGRIISGGRRTGLSNVPLEIAHVPMKGS